jgi:hypothetical protein
MFFDVQRYNWLNKSDGPLFRGRYKSVLVDEDDYLFQLTRYIHLNPLETKPPMVKELEAFAMFACRHYRGASQKQLATDFELQHPGSAAYSINKVKTEIIAGKWKMQI